MLFHCHHLSTLYQFVWLRMTKYSKHHVVMLVNHESFAQSTFARNLEKYKVFDRILTVKEPKNFSEKQREKFVLDHYDEYFHKNGLSFAEISEIYTACDLNNLFPVYCILNKRALSYIEMYAGQFEDKSRYKAGTDIFGYPYWLEELSRKYHSLSGDNGEYTIKRYLSINSSCEYVDKDVSIDFIHEFYSLPTSCKNLLIHCMELPENIDFKETNLLLLNSPKWTRAITNLDVSYHYLPYLLILDYYFRDQENIIVKNHPHAGKEDFFENEISQRTRVISALIPIEFYGLLEDFHIRRLISVESSGNTKISEFVEEEIRLGKEYLDLYPYLHKVFLVFSIANRMENSAVYRTIGIRRDFIMKLKHCSFSSQLDSEKMIPVSGMTGERIYYMIRNKNEIISNLFLELVELGNDSVAVFLDYEGLLNYISWKQDISQIEYVVPIVIEKKAIYEYILSDTDDEFLFIFCTDCEYRKQIQNMQYEYTLEHTGLHIKAAGSGAKNDKILLKLIEDCS